MSLINQMLRDLESRRKAEGQQLPSGEGPKTIGSRNSSRRLVIIVVCGVLLIAAVWALLEFISWRINMPQASVKQVSLLETVERTAVKNRAEEPRVEKKIAEDSVATVRKSKQQLVANAAPPDKKLATETPVVEKRKQPVSAVKPPARMLPSADEAKLLKIGIVEAVASTRLMLEFAQLPEYKWQFSGQDKKQLSIHFLQSTVQKTLTVPMLKRTLVTQLRLQPEKQNVQLSLEANHGLMVDILELPADSIHGPRLMVELYPQAVIVAAKKIETKRNIVPVAAEKPVQIIAEKLVEKPVAKVASAVNRVSKKAPTLTAEQQAEQAYQKALEQLQRNEKLAAETNLANALTLQPDLLDARLQLITLLQKAKRNREVDKLLQRGLQLHPDNPELRKCYARSLLDDGHLAGAIDVLCSRPQPKVGDDLEYYALLAALQQEQGQHQFAAEGYRQLLAYRPQEALWWMGLAISLDQSGDYVGAKEAYQQAISLPGLRNDLQEYVHNRLQIL